LYVAGSGLIDVFLNVRSIFEIRNENIAASNFAESSIPRLLQIVSAHQSISSSTLTTLFGRGIGISAQTEAQRIKNQLPLNNSCIGFMLLEIGYLGLGLYLTIMYLVWKKSKQVQNVHLLFWDSLGNSIEAIVFIFILSLFYTPEVSHDPTALTFWLIFAGNYSLSESISKKSPT